MSGRLILNQIEGKSGASNIVTVPTGHRIVGVDTGSVRAPGSILQVAYGESTTQVTSSAQTYALIQSVTLISVAPNSRYFITGYSHAYSATSGTRANLGFSVTISGATTRIAGVDGSSGDSWGTTSTSGCQLNRSAVYTSTSPAGTTMVFNLLGTSYENTTLFNFAGYNHRSTITVMEISV